VGFGHATLLAGTHFYSGRVRAQRNHLEAYCESQTYRTTLADVKARRDVIPQQNRNPEQGRRAAGRNAAADGRRATADANAQAAATANRNSRRIYYYKKQIDAHTPMVLVLQDGEEIEGTIEWYDRGALKINRRSAPNLLVLKRNIKYMYKAEERVGKVDSDERTEAHGADETSEPAFEN
jgi:hypothetical protein